MDYQHDPVQITRATVYEAINMLGLAKRQRVSIFEASTIKAYVDPSEHPQPETCLGDVNLTDMRGCYDEVKRCAETLFFDYHRPHCLDIRVVGNFNTYCLRIHPKRWMN